MKKYLLFLLPALFILLTQTASFLFAQEALTAQDAAIPESAQAIKEPEKSGGHGLISLSFKNADINQVIKVLGDLTGTIIIPHEQLKGQVNIVSLEKVKPETVISVLESALLVQGFTLVKSGDALKVMPISEIKQTNVEVKVGARPDIIEDKDVVITQVIPLKFSSAVKIKNDLQTLIGKHGNIIANERANTVIITDTSANIKRLATIIVQIDQQLPAKSQIQPFVINYGDAAKIAKILNDLSAKGDEEQYPDIELLARGDKPFQIFGKIEAFVEENSNIIVVSTAPINFPAIEKLIRRLDVFPLQAMIEVVIMDVTLDDDFKMGVEVAESTAPTVTTSGIKVDLTDDTHKESTFHSFLGLQTDASTRGFTYRVLNKNETMNLLGFILDTQENSKVLSTPRILASNNQESSIIVGQEIPIIESSVTDLVNNVTTVNFKYEDVGLQLTVTPRISTDGFVNLKVHAELKDLSPQTLFDASIINKREATASVVVGDGYTVVLGGLMRDNDSIIEHKIPFLGDLPIIGHAFKKTEKSLTKTELVIFLTPHILKSIEDLKQLSAPDEEKYENIRETRSSGQLKKAVQKTVGHTRPKKTPKKKVRK